MKKSDWEDGLKKMTDLLVTAKKNVETAQMQQEELEFNISNYQSKIETFK